MLYAVAGLLAAVGAGFLLAAFLSFQSDGSARPAGILVETPTPTAVSAFGGARTVPAASDETPTDPTETPPTPTAAATEAAETAAPSASVPTEVPAPTSTPVPTTAPAPPAPPPTHTPTEAPTAEPTATPSGPVISITGPATAAVGEALHYSIIFNTAPDKWTWKYSGGTKPVEFSISPVFNTDGCETIELEAIYFGGPTLTVFQQVAVGTGTCP